MSAPQMTDRQEILLAVELIRSEASAEAEEGLSVNTWLQRVQNAARAAHNAARSGSDTEEEFWLDIAAMAVGRVEQLRRLSAQDECVHDFGDSPEPASRCVLCGLLAADFMEARDQAG